jgi:UDP-glucuronate 4-epimerase
VGLDNYNDYYSPDLKRARDHKLRQFANFVSIEGDLADLPGLEGLFQAHRPQKICHLAAQAGVRYSLINPFAYQKSNLEGFLNLLELAKRFKPERLVYASSSSVYAGLTEMPFSETQRVDTPISLYAATKKANELMAHAYSHLFGLQTIGLRFFTVYGPGSRPDVAMWLFTETPCSGQAHQGVQLRADETGFYLHRRYYPGVSAALTTSVSHPMRSSTWATAVLKT